MARAQRVSFSAEEGGGARTKNKAEQAQSGMDAETRRSIGEGDKKSEKSMKTVKVGASMTKLLETRANYETLCSDVERGRHSNPQLQLMIKRPRCPTKDTADSWPRCSVIHRCAV